MGKFGKLLFLFFISYIHDSFSMEESLSDLYELLENPKLFAKFEKRLALLAQSADPADVDCYETIGTLNEDCRFHSNGSTIIKTKESLARGASFLEEFANVSCPTECTRLCCDKPACDTAVYQDKNDHKCYLFQCGEVGNCVFAEHDSYWTGWVSTINLHTDAQEPYVLSHENDLANVGSQSNNGDTPEVKETEPPTTPTPKIPTTTSRPGLGQYCESYETVCEDPHAECLMKSCKCRVGYHQKHGICRKHCRDEEFECENIVYGSESRQCVLNRYVCDGHSDCIDGSDELNCQQNNKYAFLDTDSSAGGSNNPYNPFFNSPYNGQAGVLPGANQIYPNQIQPNGNTGGQYMIPGLTNQNQGGMNLMPGNANQQWSQNGLGSQIYQNGYPYQQSGYYPPNSGYAPIAPGPGVAPVNVQPVQQQNGKPAGVVVPQQQAPATQQVQAPAAQPNTLLKQDPLTSLPIGNPNMGTNNQAQLVTHTDESKDMDYLKDHLYDTVTVGDPVDTDYHNKPVQSTDRSNGNMDTSINQNGGSGAVQKPSNSQGQFTGRHSSEDSRDDDDSYAAGGREVDSHMRTYPPTTKSRTQVGSPTQSTIAGHKAAPHGSSHSEGLPDYSWIHYNDQTQRVGGKKGSVRKPSGSQTTSNTNKQPTQVTSSKSTSVKQNDPQQKPAGESGPAHRTDNRKKPTDSNDDYRFDDYRRPNNNNRPAADGRYEGHYDVPHQRPSSNSRYPYYDNNNNNYPRNRGHNPYPVWDSYKDEYYYPDSFEDRPVNSDFEYGNDRGMHNPGGRRPDNNRFHDRPDNKDNFHLPHADVPHRRPSTSTVAAPNEATKSVSQEPGVDGPVPTDVENAIDTPDTQTSTDTDNPPSETDDNQAPTDTDLQQASADTDSDSPTADNNGSESKPQENIASQDSNGPVFHILNSDSGAAVETLPDNSQGPVVALSLGLAITMMLLIVVGCRLRTVKRRLRKGRALHSNEADYLINGMYL